MTVELKGGPLHGYVAQLAKDAWDAHIPVSRFVERTLTRSGEPIKARRRVRMARYALTGKGFAFAGYVVR